jgi:hypothetical protein
MKIKSCMGLGLLFGIPLLFAGCATTPKETAVLAQKLAPLQLFCNDRDNFTTATAQGEADAKAAGYHFVRIEGYVFASPQSNTVPLRQYWSAKRHDYLLTKAISKTVEKNGAYEFIRVEGHAYAEPQPDTVPLKRFKQASRDNFTTATAQGEKDALTAGYDFERIEAYVIPAPVHSSGAAQMTGDAITSQTGIVLEGGDRLNTPNTFRPPVEITIVAKTDSTNLRIGYAADQVIFNWEMDREQLRVDGGPADGRHKAGAGSIPAGKFVTIRWLVTATNQAIYVGDRLRFEHSGDYSNINKCVSVFPAGGSKVTVKSISVRRLSSSHPTEALTATQTSKVEAVSAKEIRKWITQLADPDFSKREGAVNELARHSAAALPALKQALKAATDSDRRWWIQSAIQGCQEKKPAK